MLFGYAYTDTCTYEANGGSDDYNNPILLAPVDLKCRKIKKEVFKRENDEEVSTFKDLYLIKRDGIKINDKIDGRIVGSVKRDITVFGEFVHTEVMFDV